MSKQNEYEPRRVEQGSQRKPGGEKTRYKCGKTGHFARLCIKGEGGVKGEGKAKHKDVSTVATRDTWQVSVLTTLYLVQVPS